ncbi:MAG: AMP-binding protein [Paracoccus sp. (in: a-proteobacteria)]
MNPMNADDVASAFALAASAWPERPFLNILPETAAIYDIAAGQITYSGAQSRITALRDDMRKAGLRAGHRIMLGLQNRPDFFLYWIAANGLGASVVPVNPDLRAAELTHMAGLTRPVLAIATPDRHDDLSQGCPGCVIIAPGDPIPHIGADPAFDDAPGRACETAVLFTSGSTGKPKGCVLSNDYFLRAGAWYAAEGGLCALRSDGERMLTPLPVFHMNAMAYSLMAMIATGGCLTVLDRFHPRSWWQSVHDSGATCVHYLGVMPSMLMGLTETGLDRAHQVRFGFGAGVDSKLHAAFEDRFGFPLVEAWAMTETGAGAVIAASQLPRRVGESALGRPGDGMEYRLEPDGDDPAQGELLVRASGPDPRAGFFREYLADPVATSDAWAEGWFHTGDIVRRAPDGQIHFVDRKKNVIRRSGENIAAVEVESALIRHPAVASVGVAAVPDALRGDEVFACIVANGTLDSRELVEWALGQLAYYKVPGYVALVDALPLTPTNKLQRAELKAMAAALLGDPATHDLRHMKKRQP